MVRGRRVRCAKNDEVSASPKRKDSRMENIGGLANGVNHSPTGKQKNGIENTKKNGFITNYFAIVSPDKNLHLVCDPLLCESETGSVSSEPNSVEEKTEHFALNCFTGYESFNDIIHSSCGDIKNNIINDLFKKRVESDKCALFNAKIKAESVEVEEISNDKKNDDPFDTTNLRLSPRKHASTLERCVSTSKENVKTPHRIGLSEPFSSSIKTEELNLQPQKNRTRRRLNRALEEATEEKPEVEIKQEVKLPLTEIVEEEGALTVTKTANKTKSKAKAKQTEGKLNGNASHKLTEYFPIRRSARKTKKEVLEEKQKDLEMAIKEERESGLTVTHFDNKGRGVVASKHFQRGDFVVEYAGELVSLTEAKVREARYAHDRNTGCYMYYFRHGDQQYCIDATKESGRLGRLVNHSRNGNLTTKSVFIGSRPHLVLLAKQDIRPGQEITYDYGDRSKESLQHHPWLAF